MIAERKINRIKLTARNLILIPLKDRALVSVKLLYIFAAILKRGAPGFTEG